jgi:hypothetical protein
MVGIIFISGFGPPVGGLSTSGTTTVCVAVNEEFSFKGDGLLDAATSLYSRAGLLEC